MSIYPSTDTATQMGMVAGLFPGAPFWTSPVMQFRASVYFQRSSQKYKHLVGVLCLALFSTLTRSKNSATEPRL